MKYQSLEYQSVLIPIDLKAKSKRPERSTWVDIETKKVEIDRWVRETGEAVGRRWEPILIGTGFCSNGEWFVEMTFEWTSWVKFFEGLKVDSDLMVYDATREFDEMILKGRFHNARRAHFPERPKGYPGIDEDLFDWVNIRKEAKPKQYERSEDVESKYVPESWKCGDETRVLVHLFRDVVGLILEDPEVDVEDFSGVAKYLEDYCACEELIEQY